MKRKIYKELLHWKDFPRRKPLILKGARQVGKSWILKEFGSREFKYLAYISCDNSIYGESLFSDFDIPRIIRSVEAIANVPVIAGETLIVFDEIQEIPKGLTSLKYFCEDAPEYHVAVAGSLLGITLNRGISFPVGKVDFLEMYPMDFEEFLWAAGQSRLSDLILSDDHDLMNRLHSKSEGLLRQYYFCGGMPEAVKSFIEGSGVIETRRIQNAIIEAYRNDIGKHAPVKDVERIHHVLNSLPSQLIRENKKFVYSAVRKGARASEFELAIQWLVDAGLIYKVDRVTEAGYPLPFYRDFNAFKLYFLDCGLFGAISDTDAASILMGESIYKEYKGSFSELYICQQLIATGHHLFYYSADNSRIEIDFLIQFAGKILPIEVKAGGNVKGKSLKLFMEKNALDDSVRFSMLPYIRQEKITNIPLYAAFALDNFLDRTGREFQREEERGDGIGDSKWSVPEN